MGRIVLAGLGPLTPIGNGTNTFWGAIMDNSCGIKKITKFSTTRDCYGGEIGDINFEEYITDSRFRRAADISKYTMLAVKLATDDANISTSNGKNMGITVGLTLGALNYTLPYHKLLITEGAGSASPILFSDSVLNAPAGNASICFGVHGPVHTIIGGKTITIKAIMLAAQMLTTGEADKTIVVCAEEMNELSFLCYLRLGLKTMSEGAGAILLEDENTLKGGVPYCYISGISSRFNPSNLQAALREAIEESLEIAHLKEKDIDLIVTDASISDIQGLDLCNKPLGCITHLTGDAFSVSSMWNVILSALVIRQGIVPASVVDNNSMDNIHTPYPLFLEGKKAETPAEIKNVMICVVEDEGVASAMILSEYS